MGYRRRDGQLERRCAFCGRPRDEVRKLVAGPGVFICDRCIAVCRQLMLDERRSVPAPPGAGAEHGAAPPGARLRPRDIAARLDEWVVAQDRAKRMLAVASTTTASASPSAAAPATQPAGRGRRDAAQRPPDGPALVRLPARVRRPLPRAGGARRRRRADAGRGPHPAARRPAPPGPAPVLHGGQPARGHLLWTARHRPLRHDARHRGPRPARRDGGAAARRDVRPAVAARRRLPPRRGGRRRRPPPPHRRPHRRLVGVASPI